MEYDATEKLYYRSAAKLYPCVSKSTQVVKSTQKANLFGIKWGKKWRMKTKKRKKDNWQKENVHKGKHSPRDAVITCSVQATTASVSPTETLIKSHASSETEHENSTSPSSPEMHPISLPVAPTVVLYFSQLGTLALHRCRNLMADRTKRRLNHGCAVTRAITLRMSHCSEVHNWDFEFKFSNLLARDESE